MRKQNKKTKRGFSRNTAVYYIFIAAAAFAVYANSLSNDFVFDDESVVLGDPSITDLSNIPKYFTAEEGFHKVIGRYYRPVVSSLYALDYAVWKLDPFGFHLTNVLIHVINSLLILKLLFMIFAAQDAGLQKSKLIAVIFAGLVFAVHTIHTEAVSWVSGRTDSLSFTFFAASFIYYLKYHDKKKPLHFFLVLFFYSFSLLSKEMAITFPLIVVAYDILVNKKREWKDLRNNLPVYISIGVISVLYIFLRWLILKDIPQRETYFYFYGKDMFTVIFTMLQTIPLYFRLLVVPIGLLYHYNVYLPYQSSLVSLEVILPALFVVLMVSVFIALIKRFPLVSYSILFVLITLVPVMNIVPTMNFMAERFLYIPSAALSFVLSALIIRFYNNRTKQALFGVLSVVIIFYSYLTIERNFDWKNNDTLFMSADGRPGSLLYVNIANIYANRQEYDKAEILYRKALDLRDETLLANTNLGKIFLIKGNFDSAYHYIYKSHLLDTLSPEPMFALAQLFINNNNTPAAINWLEKIQKVTPNYMNSVKMLEEMKRSLISGSETQTKPGSQRNNSKIMILEQESFNNYQQKNYDKAIEQLKELAELNPLGRAGYYNNIGMSYLEQNKLNYAKKYFELSAVEDKNFSTAYNNLGNVYEKLGDKLKARESYLKVLETDPNNQSAKENLSKLK